MELLLSKITFCLAILNAIYGHPIPTYFGRFQQDGTLMNVNGPEYRLKVNFLDSRDSFLRSNVESVAYLKVVPGFVSNGAEVEVVWRSSRNSSRSDFIALYCPHKDHNSKYLDYLFLNETKSTFSRGLAKFKVQLFNMRVNCEMRYFASDSKSAQMLAKSNLIRFKGNEPLQGRLALTGNPSEMRVMWTSGTGMNVLCVDCNYPPETIENCHNVIQEQ